MGTGGICLAAADGDAAKEEAGPGRESVERPLHDRALLRSEFVRQLASVEDAIAAQLIESLADDRDWVVRGSAAWALGKRAGSTVESALFRLAYDEHPFVRFRAIASLGEVEAGSLLERIALEKSRDPRERLRSVHAMRDVAGAEVDSALMSIADAAVLCPVSVAAVAVLVHRKVAGMGGRIREVLNCDDWRIKVQIVGVLRNLGREAIPYLDIAMADGDWHVRAGAAEQCGSLNEPEALSLLVTAAGDPHPMVRLRAVEGLGRSCEKHAPLLRLSLSDSDRTVRIAAIKALGSRRPCRTLKALGSDPDQLVGAAARRVVGRKARRIGSNA